MVKRYGGYGYEQCNADHWPAVEDPKLAIDTGLPFCIHPPLSRPWRQASRHLRKPPWTDRTISISSLDRRRSELRYRRVMLSQSPGRDGPPGEVGKDRRKKFMGAEKLPVPPHRCRRPLRCPAKRQSCFLRGEEPERLQCPVEGRQVNKTAAAL